ARCGGPATLRQRASDPGGRMRLYRSLLAVPVIAVVVAVPAAAQSGSFGTSVIVRADELIIGEPNTNFRPGTVYVYRRSGGEWREAAQLRAPDADRADGFGAVLAAADNTLFVAQRGGRLYAFSRVGNDWLPAGEIPAEGLAGLDPGCNQYGYCGTNFGIALAAEGDWLLVGEPRSVPGAGAGQSQRRDEADAPRPAGVVHVVLRDGGGWTRQAQLTPSDSRAGDAFG